MTRLESKHDKANEALFQLERAINREISSAPKRDKTGYVKALEELRDKVIKARSSIGYKPPMKLVKEITVTQ